MHTGVGRGILRERSGPVASCVVTQCDDCCERQGTPQGRQEGLTGQKK